MSSKASLWNSGHDESVEVNQRALIDKVLARYSGEFTVFRELLQNSDDAGSKSVEIHFNTQAYLDRTKSNDGNSGSSGTVTMREKAPDLKEGHVHQWTFKNNGMIFRDEDWNRLKKIAEGNPDEEKIGAFGVGFYSLFSITEEPFVTSGNQWMGFYWKDKKDQLFARRGTLPPQPEPSSSTSSNSSSQEWTTFEMPLREPAPIPPAFDFARFLASSIAFMIHLRDVSVFLDGKMLAKLSKAPGNSENLSIPQGLKVTSPAGMMVARTLRTTPLHIKAEIARCVYTSGTAKPTTSSTLINSYSSNQSSTSSGTGFFSSLFASLAGTSSAPARSSTPTFTNVPLEDVDPYSITESSVTLAIFSAGVDVRLDKKMIVELQRSTKKNPPTTLNVDLIYTGKVEYDASRDEDKKNTWSTGSVFQGLRADLVGSGSTRIYIGHATGQTTGIGGHLAARFIPTVERESIDLVDRNVSTWNKELLYVGGLLARAAYEIEMTKLRELWLAATEPTKKGDVIKAAPNEELQTYLRDRCLHALRFFTFHQSTPSAVVSTLLESGFFSCAISRPFLIMSTAGVKPASDVRVFDKTFTAFLKELPFLPDEIMTGASQMVGTLRSRNLIKEITFMDVLAELRERPLTEGELIACMKWWVDLYSRGASSEADNLPRIREELLGAAVLIAESPITKEEKIIPLSTIKTFVDPYTTAILLNGPLPDHTLPVSVSKAFAHDKLQSAFGWKELSIVEWLQHITDSHVKKQDVEFDITSSPIWAERVLNAIARGWPTLTSNNHGKPGSDQQSQVIVLLKNEACVPTRAGLKVPEEAYFQNANIFPDLPVIAMPKGSPVRGNLEKVLQALGVRRHVELQIIFDRMVKSGDWTVADLIKYFVAIQKNLTKLEFARLENTPVFMKEMPPTGAVGSGPSPKYIASDLYEPLDAFRELCLPVIDWGKQPRWRSSSEEAKFLFSIGLRRFPPLNEIITMAASEHERLRAAALKYFLDNRDKHYTDYDPKAFANIAFIPAITADGKSGMSSPSKVFVDPDASVLGFNVVDVGLRDVALTKLGLQRQPPTSMILPLLETSAPREPEKARQWFEVLAGRIADFSQSQLNQMGQMKFVPTTDSFIDGPQANKSSPTPAVMRTPKECYFRQPSMQTLHSKFFIFVDFGTKANSFLSACGVKNEPSVEAVVQILLADPKKFYNLAGSREGYLTELRNIAALYRSIPSTTRRRMERASILLASKRVKTKGKSDSDPKAGGNDLDEESWDLDFDLLRGDQIVIADDTNAYQVFGDAIFSAPQEDLLEAFYIDLGSHRLSALVHEEHKVSMEIRDSKIAHETRALILERLPLFLYEHTHARTKVQYSWLNDEKNFIVRTFGKLTVTKHLSYGGQRLAKSQDASAAGKRQGNGPIELWLAGNAQVDLYEVAISLCRMLFDAPKVNDALLFMTILSTDLRALRRRGYNVDRILKKQRADREAAEAVRKNEERLLSDSNAPPLLGISARPPPAVPPKQPLVVPNRPKSPESILSDTNTLIGGSQNKAGAAAGLMGSLQHWKKKLQTGGTASGQDKGPVLQPTHNDEQHDPAFTPLSSPPGAAPPVPSRPGAGQQQKDKTPTPRSNINANVNQAIQACKAENGHLLHNIESMQTVKETAGDGFCDISGFTGELICVGAMSDMKVYVSHDLPNGSALLSSKHDAVARFTHVLQALRNVYQLPATSLHIYCDVAGPTMGFNRNGSIFLNLRYFEAWHDAEVHTGDMSKALIFWFFTLGHEIAHNLVQVHDSQHEFWFSSICETHTIPLMQLISKIRPA